MTRQLLFLRAKTFLSAGALAASIAGCDLVLGIHEVERDPSATGGGGQGGATGGQGGQGGGATTSTTGGQGGQGGSQMGDFTFGLKTAKVILPQGGQAFVEVEIVPSGGFDGPVDISLEITPTGVTFEGTSLAAGTTTGAAKIGAGGVLTIGDKVPLTFVATSGSIVHKVSTMGTVTGQPGALVEGFGAAGVASWVGAMDGTNVFDVREVAQNKIVVAGDHIPGLAVTLKGARVLPNGMMDVGFGPNGDGTVTAQFCGCTKSSGARAVVREIGGRVLMIGTGNAGSGFLNDVAIARYKDDGSFDNIGGDAGKTLVDLGGVDYGAAATLANDGLVVIAASRDDLLTVLKLNDFFDGIDMNFGTNGQTQFPPGMTGIPVDIAVDPADGHIVMLSETQPGANSALLVARFGPTGQPVAFGPNGQGYLEVPGVGDLKPASIAIDSQGRIVIAGTSIVGGDANIFVGRLLSDGKPDMSFGQAGATVLSQSGSQNVADMVVLADDRVVVTGMSTQPFLARLLSDGTPDPTFGTEGYTQFALGSMAVVQTMAVSKDGEIFLAGSRESQPAKGFVAKIWQ